MNLRSLKARYRNADLSFPLLMGLMLMGLAVTGLGN